MQISAGFIVSDILDNKSLKKCLLAAQRWILIMEKCYQQGDYHSCRIISAALSNRAISRLTKTDHTNARATWDLLSPNVQILIEKQDDIFITKQGKPSQREIVNRINKQETMVAPFLGVYKARFETTKDTCEPADWLNYSSQWLKELLEAKELAVQSKKGLPPEYKPIWENIDPSTLPSESMLMNASIVIRPNESDGIKTAPIPKDKKWNDKEMEKVQSFYTNVQTIVEKKAWESYKPLPEEAPRFFSKELSLL